MKKRIFVKCFALLLALLMLATGCSQPSAPTNENEPADSADKPEYVCKVGYGEPANPNTSLECVITETFKESLERLSDGRIEVEVYPGGTMGASEEIIQQTQIGAMQGGPVADAKLAALFAPINVLSIPYLFDDVQVANKVLDSEFVTKMIEEICAQTGLRTVGIGSNGGFRHFSNSVREIKTPADMKGMKFRVMQSPLMITMVESIGAIPVAMAFSELYTSLQTNVVQGQENPSSVIRAQNLQEVQKFYTLDGHTYSSTFFMISDEWYQSLPADLQAAVDQAGLDAAKASRETAIKWDTEALDELAGKGMQIYKPTAEELLLFREATQPAAIEYLKQNIDSEWVDGVMDAVENARVELGL